ncbi:pilus assembly protein TadG-related protein [Streptomyces sp. NPDC058374]|uniref:pilus assembly protein TadG-related protein n=1 Tax=Streptomyces sp. NPDC058374 TaxID=3346466 RepID=UPI00364FB2D2
MRGKPCRDRGQSLPLFIWISGMLLFVAFAFFAFAQAAVARNGAQSAADAAALAAAQESRLVLADGLIDSIGDSDQWLDWLNAEPVAGEGTEVEAGRLASLNGAEIVDFRAESRKGLPAFWVRVQSLSPVGDSVIPGTESTKAKAEAVAAVEPRCEMDEGINPEEEVAFRCGGELHVIDPDDFEHSDFPEVAEMFAARLVG